MSWATEQLAAAQAAYTAVCAQLDEGRAVIDYMIRGRRVTSTDPGKTLEHLGKEIERLQRMAAREGRSMFRVASVTRASRRGST
jgi:hypothetical protein